MLRRCVRIFKCRGMLGEIYRLKQPSISSKVFFSSFDKDLPNPNLPTPSSKMFSPDTDILLDQIKKARSMERILELCSMHIDVMNAKHVVKCIDLILEFFKSENYSCKDLMEHETFQALCSKLMKTIRFLEVHDLITAFKALSGLGIRNNTYVMQSVLKMIGTHLNDMSLGQLTFLNFLLSKQKHNSLVDGLRLALPLVLQVQIEQQLDSDNFSETVDCFQLACRARLKPATVQKVLSTVLGKAKLLNPTTATTVIFALLHLETPLDGYKELLSHSFEVISRNIETLGQKPILSLLRICSSQNQYNSRFFFSACDQIAFQEWNLKDTYEAMGYFYKLKFCPPKLIDHFISAICSESYSIQTDPSYSILNCVEYLTLSGYRPQKVYETFDVILSSGNKIREVTEKTPLLFLKFLSCLAMLGYFPSHLLSKALHEDFLCYVWSTSRKLGRTLDFERSAFCLAWSFQVFDQKNLAFPSAVLKNLTEILRNRFSEKDIPLEKFIENGLGGSQFVKSGLFTNDGILIDHVVAMRSGNYPVSLEPNTDTFQSSHFMPFVEDLVLPTDAKIVTVIVAQQGQYCHDPEILKGWVDLKVKCLAKKKYTPVVINYGAWQNLPDREKIPYLMHNIKQAVHEDSCTYTNTF